MEETREISALLHLIDDPDGEARRLQHFGRAARRYDIAETRLARLLRSAPDFAEAWHKRATLYYLLARDDECIADIRRTLELEPRHFCAMLHFGEILFAGGATEEGRFAFRAVLSLHPNLPRARQGAFDNP